MADIEVVTTETGHVIKRTFTLDGATFDLSTYTITFYLINSATGTAVLSGVSADFTTDGTDGAVQYSLDLTSISDGKYYYYFKLTDGTNTFLRPIPKTELIVVKST